MTTKTTAKTAPAKKPAAKKAPVPASKNAPRYQVVDDVFVWLGDGSADPIRIPLRIKTKLLRTIMRLEKDGGAEELDQLFALLDGVGDQESIAAIDEQWFEETGELVEAYFTEFQVKHKATPGESSGS